ncbi:8239_t:CDS:2 [Ambispora gerdemannii]|uniref:Beige protein homolog 1 n=1 Tax=Ambispora gerdemannii TaxID=144530 RepID=A0A9N9F8W9_9GLOM|nr:8239_t:CDS:2 [Ambispora gerdemannii]
MSKCQSYLTPLEESKFFSDTLETIWKNSKFDEQAFVQFVTSRDWIAIHDRLIVPAMKAANDDDFTVVRRLKAAFSKKFAKFLFRSKKEEQNVAKFESAFDTELNNIVQSYKEEENNRLTNVEVDKKNEMKRTSHRWQSKFHELTQERGAWSLQRQTEIHWKLDKSENYSRMHRKLTINYEYDPHNEASAKRDKTPILQNRNRSKSVSIQRFKMNNMIDPWTDMWTSILPKVDESESSDEFEDEEWNVVAGDDVVGTVDVSIDKPMFSAECELIVLLSAIKGRIELTTTNLSFFVDRQSILQEFSNIEQGSVIVDTDMLRDKKWLLSDIREIALRNYLLRRSALEFFMIDQTNYFFNFPEPNDRKLLRKKIISLKPPSMVNQDSRSPTEILANSGITHRWQCHEISNFEYLMHLNTIAGRSYNDLSQYPVFPWILADYDSETIDLTDPKVYRDLSKPIGALDPNRLAQVLERYEGFEDPSGRIPKFHYGTHYSSAATVAGYLIRLEPFTSVHISLQGGKFDHADRQFHSIESTWNACLHASGDVRELIPEFFYLPEFLINNNKYDLGVRQDGVRLDDVILPKWASSPEEFIRINREALESDHVTANLHHWIDLIFGYKQTGEEAIRAHNVFYYLTYENKINIDSIEDEHERKSIEQQIYHFGQTPIQLLRKPHPQRFPRREFIRKDILSCQENHKQYLVQLISKRLLYIAVSNVDIDLFSTSPVQQIVTIDEDGIVGSHRITPNPVTAEIPFSVEVDPMLEYKSRLNSPFCYDAAISPRCFTCSRDGKVLISCGHWDNTIKVTLTETGKTIDSIPGHDDIVTTVAVSEDGRTIVTGSRSSSVLSWNINLSGDNEFLYISHTPTHAYYGHDDEITCVAANAEHDILVSGSKDGTCIVHSLRNGYYVRTLRPLDDIDATVENVCVSKEGNIIVYAERKDEYFIYSYSINGKLLGTVEIQERLNDMITSSIKDYVLISNARGIALFDCLSLQLNYEFDIPIIAHSIALSQDASRIYFCGGGDDGKILIIANQSHVESSSTTSSDS